jgi:rubrerythrin
MNNLFHNRATIRPRLPGMYAAESSESNRKIIWTACPKCGDVWTTRAIVPKAKCPVCGGKVKVQKEVF